MKHPQLDQFPRYEGKPGQLPPGLHTVVIDSFTELEDKIIAQMLTKHGHSLRQNLVKARAMGKSVTLKIFDDVFWHLDKKGKRSLRNRHHKAKPQPNHGPRKPNQW